MDLSHWDLIGTLTTRQIGILAVGLDPNMNEAHYEPIRAAKATTYIHALEKSSDDAWHRGAKFANDVFEPGDSFMAVAEELWENKNQKGQLPSDQLLDAIQRRFDFVDTIAIDEILQNVVRQTYQRHYIHQWFIWRGITPQYHFDLKLPRPSGDSDINKLPSTTNTNESEGTDVDEKLNTRQKNTYLKLIMALADYVPGFDPQHPSSSARKIIEQTGVTVKEKTVAKVIAEGYELESKLRD